MEHWDKMGCYFELPCVAALSLLFLFKQLFTEDVLATTSEYKYK